MRAALAGIVLVIAAVVILGSACSDPREQAVNEVLSFAASAPFDIAEASDQYTGYRIIVEDSALSQYNSVFRYFEPGDTTRPTVYEQLPSELFWGIPVTDVQRVSIQGAGGDTLLATVVHERPNRELFSRRFAALLSSDDNLSPTEQQRVAFRNALSRTRQELQETDTAYIWVTSGPHIVRFRTASGIRDSVTRDSLTQIALLQIQRLASDVRFSLQVDDYSQYIQGTVEPREVAWYQNALVWVIMMVECEGRRGDETTTEVAYLPETNGRGPVDYICLWSGDEWARVKPDEFRVRLVARLGADSVLGPWHR